jgi:uncharacterized caspase-like protein
MEASMLKYLAACLTAALLLFGSHGPAAAEKRVALVIGNSAYQHTPALKNPSNDATDIAAALRQLDFDVIDGTDLTKDEMEQRIREFAAKLAGADVGLFFYAGHGLQVDGKNFLAPVDAKLQSDTDLDFEAVELNLVLKQLERNSRISVVFLDACRDNPLATTLAATSRSVEVGRGLARIDKAVGMMIAFSTQPGNVALDGEGRNSPFTGALLHHIATEGASINDVMIDVRNDVLKATDGKQVPWENSSLTGQFFFKPKAPPTIADQTADSTAQIAALRQEIERLQADQGARLTAQQEQLEILQHKLASETKTADELAAAQGSEGKPNAVNRVIAVEPASDAKPESDVTAADSKVAAADATQSKAPEAAPPSPAPLPEGVTQTDLVQDIVSQLKDLDCYQGRVNGSWGRPAQDALERFNTLAKLDLPIDEPQQATLDALKEWKGPHCTIEAAVPHKGKASKYQAAKPPATYKKSVTPRPYHPQASARATSPRPRAHNDNVGDEQRELQRLFPQTRWPGQQ